MCFYSPWSFLSGSITNVSFCKHRVFVCFVLVLFCFVLFVGFVRLFCFVGWLIDWLVAWLVCSFVCVFSPAAPTYPVGEDDLAGLQRITAGHSARKRVKWGGLFFVGFLVFSSVFWWFSSVFCSFLVFFGGVLVFWVGFLVFVGGFLVFFVIF